MNTVVARRGAALLAVLFVFAVARAGEPPTPLPAPAPEPEVLGTAPATSAPLPRVKLTTSHGDLEIELYEDDAPNTVANFIELCEKHFFDGLKFHDVINNRWVQTGDPTGTGRGGPSYKFAHEVNAESLGLDKIVVKDFVVLYKIKAQPGTEQLTLKDLYEKQGFHFVPNLKSHPVVKGAVAMAYRVADTNGSQFFIALNDCPWLDGKHTVFGHVTSGLEILKLVQKGDIVEKIEILYKRDHPYHVKTLEGKAEPVK
jgi:cyclophilin family peptidyl-prolyl cis-trans isomerase